MIWLSGNNLYFYGKPHLMERAPYRLRPNHDAAFIPAPPVIQARFFPIILAKEGRMVNLKPANLPGISAAYHKM